MHKKITEQPPASRAPTYVSTWGKSSAIHYSISSTLTNPSHSSYSPYTSFENLGNLFVLNRSLKQGTFSCSTHYFCTCMIICLEYLLRSHYLSWVCSRFILSCLCWSLFLLVSSFCLNMKSIIECRLPCLNVCLYLLVFVFLDTLATDYKALYPWAPHNLLEEVSIYISREQIVAFRKSECQNKCHF